MRTAARLFSLLALTSTVLGDVAFSVPVPGGSYAAGTAVPITWAESSTAPLLSTFSTYDLTLYAGTNDALTPLKVIVTGAAYPATTQSVVIDPGLGGMVANGYILGIKSYITGGTGYVINYSSRFSMTGMTGSFAAAFVIPAGTITGPARTYVAGTAAATPEAAATPATAPAAGAIGAMTIPFNLQTGPIRYAPMQMIPPKAITATNTVPLYPTSSVPIASAFLPIQTSITSTKEPDNKITTFSSHANTAAARAQPTDDMQRFLNRWKD